MPVNLSSQSQLLKRIVNAHLGNEKVIFLIGSGMTAPVGDYRGVMGVESVSSLIREILRERHPEEADSLESYFDREKCDATKCYQQLFDHLRIHHSPDFTNWIIRRAVLAARLPNERMAFKVERIEREFNIPLFELKSVCEEIEQDLEHWSLRPGIEALGKILKNFYGSFGEKIITTNFDPLIEVSVRLAKGSVIRTVLPIDGLIDLTRTDPGISHVIHIHGDWSSGLDTLHTDAILRAERPYLESNLRQIISNRLVVIAGYAGWDDVFTKALSKISYDLFNQSNVLWLFYESDENVIEKRYQHLFKRLDQGGHLNHVQYFKGIDADDFFPKLLFELENDRVQKDGAIRAIAKEEKTPNAPHAPARVVPDIAHFLSMLEKRCDYSIVKDIPEELRPVIQEPNFLLFERNEQILMTIGSSRYGINENALQKTNEPQISARLLPPEHVREVGFEPGKVHPMSRDPQSRIYRIFWDADLLLQFNWFPESLMALPLYHADGTAEKILAPIGAVLDTLIDIQGRQKIVFANIVARKSKIWTNPELENLLQNRPIVTRFAPTPSNHLHVGNARTAVINHLLTLKHGNQSKRYLRIDDTDPNRRESRVFVQGLKEDLKWLGLNWNDEFHQDSRETNDKYRFVLKALEKCDFIEETDRSANQKEGGTVLLNDRQIENYYRIYFDWKEGPVISHDRWSTKFNTKTHRDEPDVIKLFRPTRHGKIGNAFYNYAGLVDDIRDLPKSNRTHLTYVVRGFDQVGSLTPRQSHILQVIETARQKLKSDRTAAKWFRDADIDPESPICLPLYLHVDLVTDEANESLSKRNAKKSPNTEKYQLVDLRCRQKVLPESIISYLMTTIIPPEPGRSLKEYLLDTAMVTAHVGIEQALKLFSQKVEIAPLVRSSSKIKCIYKHILQADCFVAMKLPLWRLKSKMRKELGQTTLNEEQQSLASRIAKNAHLFGGWSQVLAVINGPEQDYVLDTETALQLKALLAATPAPGEFADAVLEKISQLKSAVEVTEAADSARTHRTLIKFYRELRGALIGFNSPPVTDVIKILGPDETTRRLKKAMEVTDAANR